MNELKFTQEAIAQMNTKDTIIFDLGGVLLREPERNLSKILIKHGISANDQTRIFNRMFEFANLVANADCKKNWFLGKISSTEALKIILDSIDKKEHKTFFSSEHERLLIKFGSQYILLPNHLANLTDLDKIGLNYARKLKSINKRILILSNWDPESLSLVKSKFGELFSLFDKNDIFVPSVTGYIKPEKECFEFLINKAKIDPKRTIFIDDSISNINSAMQHGFTTIHHQNWEETRSLCQF